MSDPYRISGCVEPAGESLRLGLATATGWWLDALGMAWGLPRPLHRGRPASDARYRVALEDLIEGVMVGAERLSK